MNLWYFFSESPHKLKKEYEHQYRSTAVGIGDCLKCLQFLSCNKIKAGQIRAEVDLSDAAISFMDFFNIETDFDIVLSDVYVAFKLLSRLRKTKAFESNHHDQLAKTRQRPNNMLSTNRMLQQNNTDDMLCIRDAARYVDYSVGIYDLYQLALQLAGRLQGLSEIFHPVAHDTGSNELTLSNCFWLNEFDHPNTALVYGSFINERVADLIATPYCILVDNDAKKVVVAVRGSASLEDLVTDLQMSPEYMKDVGQVCGFDGSNKHAHRGILARAKWIVNDIKEKRVLRSLLPPNANDRECHRLNGYSLVFTGHSLGAACASILATMFRPIYNDVKCYGFCPPGCTASLDYAEECKEYVVSIVCGNDLIPRVNVTNFEVMRYEFFETLARIKCSKFKAIRQLRRPIKDIYIRDQMQMLLYDKENIPTHTAYYTKLLNFRRIREKEVKERYPPETRLTIPGRIIHLKHMVDDGNLTKQKYAPYWESHDSFNEIVLNLAAVQEHSVENLAFHLKSIAQAYEDGLSGVNAQDYHVEDPELLRVSQSLSMYQEIDDDEHWFDLCSRPRGSSTLLPTLFSVVAIVVSIAGNNVCSLLGKMKPNSVEICRLSTI